MKRASRSPQSNRLRSLLLILLFSAASVPWAQTALAVPESALITVYVNDRRYPDQEASVVDGTVRLKFSFYTEALAPLLEESVARLVRNLAIADDFLDTQDLRFLGFGVVYDEPSLSLRLRVPPRFMPISFLGSTRPFTGPSLPVAEAASFSAFLNSSTRLGYYRGDSFPSYTVVNEGIDAAIHFKSWIAELSFDAETSALGRNGDFAIDPDLGFARIVHDFRTVPARWSVGTVNLPWRGLESRIAALGTTFIRFGDALPLELRPSGEIRSFGDTFIIERPARVSVSVNGASVYGSRIEPGKYRFSEFPFASGLNEVVVEIAEDGKEAVRYHIGVPFDNNALRSGAVDFGVGVGVDEIDPRLPAVSGQFSYGFNSAVTVGISGQSAYGTSLGAFDLSAATLIGLFGVQSAVSYDSAAGTGVGVDAWYRFSLGGRRYLPRVGIGGRWLSSSFGAPSRDRTANAFPQWSATVQLSQATPVGLAFNLAGEYGNDGKTADADFYLSFGVTAPLGRGASAQATATLNDRDERLESTLSIALIIIPAGSQGTTLFRQNLVGGENSVDVSLTKGKGAGSLAFSLGLENAIGPDGMPSNLTSGIRRTGRLADIYTSFGSRDSRDSEGRASFVSAGIDSAAVFADGNFALARKVGDSFALLAPDPSFGDSQVSMTLGGERTAASGIGRPRVAGQLSAYRDVPVEIDTPGSPPEISVVEPRILLRPSYKSAVVVRPRPSLSYFVAGRLVDDSGSPVSWMAGTVLASDGRVVDELFTDETGLFELYDAPEGSYRIQWASDLILPTPFEIPPRAQGRIDLGAIGGPPKELTNENER